MRVLSLLIFAGLSLPSALPAAANAQGTLLIIGGGLLPNNASVFERMIDNAGGRAQARFGILPTASATDPAAKRLATRGLGFFQGGVIGQHFSQYRGRLARLARAAIERRVRFGFGIDEDTALAVAPDGTVQVLGLGNVTIVDAAGAACQDGPLGC